MCYVFLAMLQHFLQVLHMLNSILLPEYSWKFVLGSMPAKEPEENKVVLHAAS